MRIKISELESKINTLQVKESSIPIPSLPIPSIPSSSELESKINNLEAKIEEMQESLKKAVTSFKMEGIKAGLATESPQGQKTLLGERLFPLIKELYPDTVGKLTGMMIEKDNGKILKMLEDEEDLKRELKAAVDTLSKHK